jgi:hypothetical protein
MNDQTLITSDDRGPSQAGALSLNTLGTLMSQAIDKGIDLTELVNLHERLKKAHAEEQFNLAMQQFQSGLPEIGHDKLVNVKSRKEDSSYSYTFATLPHIVKTIRPLLDACGLTVSFDTSVDKGLITVSCTVHHVLGHSRTSKFEAGASGAPGMSEIQKFASTTTYGQRYALKLALGLMTVDMDDDGRGAGPGAHPNPEHNPDAPKARPRAERQAAPKQAPPTDDPVLAARLADVQRVYRLWIADAKTSDPTLLKTMADERALRFRNWVRIVSKHETLDPTEAASWGPGEVEAWKSCSFYFEQQG